MEHQHERSRSPARVNNVADSTSSGRTGRYWFHALPRREAYDLSDGDPAAAVGVSRQTINAIERERYDPSLELAFKLAALFDCRIEEIFDPRLD